MFHHAACRTCSARSKTTALQQRNVESMTMCKFIVGTLFTLLAALVSPVSLAQTADTHIQTTLLAESPNVKAGGKVMLAFRMSPDTGWHGYWENPGDAGVGMQLDWTLPAGVTAGQLQYPLPQTLVIANLMNYVYEGDYALLIPLNIGNEIPPSTSIPIAVRADWLACTDEICVPESDEFSLNLTITSQPNGELAENAAFNEFRAELPAPLGSTATWQTTDGRLRLAIPYPASADISEPYFFPRTRNVAEYIAEQKFTRDGDTLYLETAATSSPDGPISGLLRIAPDRGLDITAQPGTVSISGKPLSAPTDAKPDHSDLSIALLAFGGALLGGLVLNIMPCVFPILSLKAIALAKSGGNENAVRREALAYSAGVIVTCLLLGGTLLVLRAGGEHIGWAFQLQEPVVVLLLLLVAFAIALNLAGLFELPGMGVNGGQRGAFGTGVLAAFVATPCTGPFMAAALGSALVLSAPFAMLIFLGLGLGFALPFLAIGFVPGLRRLMPRPGPWLDLFRKFMAIPMFLTTLALLWLLGRQSGILAMTFALAVMLAAAIAFWWAGYRQRSGKSAVVALVIAILVICLSLPVLPHSATNAASADNRELAAMEFNADKLATLRSEGRPVFLYFTADWCLTCKVNEASSIERPAARMAFERADVAVMRGDWTLRDPAITRFLDQQGSAGVPLYLYYAPGAREPRQLPQILTPQLLEDVVS